MAHTYAARLTRRAATAPSSSESVDEVALERRSLRARANLALVALWAGLAVAIAVYAIDRESVGAGVLAVLVVSQLLVPWRAAFSSDDEEATRRPIAFAA
jgi:hypothetical protein